MNKTLIDISNKILYGELKKYRFYMVLGLALGLIKIFQSQEENKIDIISNVFLFFTNFLSLSYIFYTHYKQIILIKSNSAKYIDKIVYFSCMMGSYFSITLVTCSVYLIFCNEKFVGYLGILFSFLAMLVITTVINSIDKIGYLLGNKIFIAEKNKEIIFFENKKF